MTFFYTLTFNDENLPTAEGIPCFDKKQVQKFLKRLRYYLSSLGIELSYLITCEFGEQRKRPHYHALFFISKQMSAFQFLTYMRMTWKFGFVCPGDNLGVVSDRIGAIQYVAKYITKNDDYFNINLKRVYDKYYNASYFDFLEKVKQPNNLEHLYSYDEQVKEKVKQMNDCTSFEDKFKFRMWLADYISKHYAVHMISIYKKEHGLFVLMSKGIGFEALKNIDPLRPVVKLPTKNGYVNVPLPMYYYRHLYYDVVKDYWHNNRYILNQVGKEMLLSKFDERVEDNINENISLYKFATMKQTDLWKYIAETLPHNNLNCHYAFTHFAVENNLNISSEHPHSTAWYNIAVYELVYKGRYTFKFFTEHYVNGHLPLCECPQFDYLLMLEADTKHYDYFTPRDNQFYLEHNLRFHEQYDDLPCFNYLIDFIEVLHHIKIWFKRNKSKLKLEDEEKIIKLKTLCPIDRQMYSSITTLY